MDVEINRDHAALNSIKLQMVSSIKRRKATSKSTAVLLLREFLLDFSHISLVSDLCIVHTLSVLILSCAYRQPCHTLAAHKVQLPSKIAKMYEIQLTLGISYLFAKQQSINITLLAQNVMARLSQGTSYTAMRVPFFGQLHRKMHETSSLNTCSKIRELLTHKRCLMTVR